MQINLFQNISNDDICGFPDSLGKMANGDESEVFIRPERYFCVKNKLNILIYVLSGVAWIGDVDVKRVTGM